MNRNGQPLDTTPTFPFLNPAPAVGTPSGRASGEGADFSRTTYVAECGRRWSGEALRDAIHNWNHWQELQTDLLEAMRQFHRNPMLQDVSGKCHNPDGTLTALLWKMQEAWQPDKSRLSPLLDFCDHFQKVFLRRGLVIYCSMLLRQLENTQP